MKKNYKKIVVLKGEGENQHVLYAECKVEIQDEFSKFIITKDGILKHEKPNGSFAEHQSLKIEKGFWIQGKQVEYNPFEQKVTNIWD